MSSDRTVSIVILTHNRSEYTRWCIEGIRHTSFSSFEVIFVDNGSTDDTIDLIKEFAASSVAPPCKVIQNGENVGCSTARNQGAGKADGTYVVFMDNDVVVRNKNWLDGLTSPLSDAKIGATSPKLLFPFPPYLIQFSGGAVSPTGKVQFRGRGEPRTSPQHDQPRDLQCTISACMAMRTNTFRDVGGFDEAFNPVQFEDIDLSYKIRDAGCSIQYVPSVEMYHFENVTTQGSPDVRGTYQIVKNGMLFRKRWKHMFATENGPSDPDIQWANIEKRDITEIEELEYI